MFHTPCCAAVWSARIDHDLHFCAATAVAVCSLSGINLHPSYLPYKAASQALSCNFGGAHEAVQQLIDQLSDRQAEEAVAIRSGEVLPGFAGHNHHADPAEWDDSSDAGSVDEVGGGFGATLHDLSDGYDDNESSSETSSDINGQAGSAVGMQGVVSHSVAARRDGGAGRVSSGEGCIEPGVLALAVQGPVVGCIDSLGNYLLRDFSAGVPGPQALQSFAAHSASAGAAGACVGAVDGVGAVGGGASAPTGFNGSAGVGSANVDVERGHSYQPVGSEAASTEGSTAAAAAAAAEQLSKLKFWRQ